MSYSNMIAYRIILNRLLKEDPLQNVLEKWNAKMFASKTLLKCSSTSFLCKTLMVQSYSIYSEVSLIESSGACFQVGGSRIAANKSSYCASCSVLRIWKHPKDYGGSTQSAYSHILNLLPRHNEYIDKWVFSGGPKEFSGTWDKMYRTQFVCVLVKYM